MKKRLKNVFHELIFQENLKMSPERAERPDLGRFKVNWLRLFEKRGMSLCQWIQHQGQRQSQSGENDEWLQWAIQPEKRGFTTHYLIQSQLRQLLLLSTDSTFPTWHSTWTRSIQPSVLPLSGLYCTRDPLLLSSPLFFLSPFYRKPNKDTKTEKNPQFTNHIAWQHNTISFNPPVVYRVWIICVSHDQYYHHACVLIWSVVRFYNCDSIMYLLYYTPWEKIEWYLILFSLISEWLDNVKSTVINLLPHSIEKCAFDYEHTCHFMLRRTFTVIPFLCQHGANKLSTGYKKIGSMVDKKESWYCM